MTVVADQLRAEHAQFCGGFAEDAALGQFAQEEPVALDGHVEKVPFSNAKHFSELRRDHNSTEVIDFTGDALSPLIGKRFILGARHAPNVEALPPSP